MIQEWGAVALREWLHALWWCRSVGGCGCVWCDAVWCDAVWCDAVWCDAVWCGVLMWCVVWGGVLSAALSEVVQGMVGEAVWGRVSEAVRQCVRRHGS